MWVMSRDGYLLGSPAGDAMPLAMSGSSTGIKIGHQPLQAAVGASGAGWNVGSCVLECDDAALPSLASSWWLQNARLSLCSGRRELHWLHMAVEEDEDAMNRSDICLQRLAIRHLDQIFAPSAEHAHCFKSQSFASSHSLALQLQGVVLSIALSTKRWSPLRGAEDGQRQTTTVVSSQHQRCPPALPRNGASDDGYSWAASLALLATLQPLPVS